MTATITKGQIGEQDINHFDGTGTNTFSRETSCGYSLTLHKVGYEVDALIVYGASLNYTNATITTALAAIGTSTEATLLLRPGAWVISANVDWSAYTNITLKFAPGAYLSHAAYTINWGGTIDALPSQRIGYGTGAWTLNPNKVPKIWIDWFATNTAPGTTDMSAALKSAVLAANGKTLMFLDTEYLLTSAYIHVTTSQTWKSVGGHTTLIFSGKPTEDNNILVEGGSLVETSVAPPNITRGDKTITFSSDPGTLSGLLILRDSTNGSFNASRNDYVAGEICEFTQAAAVLTLKDRTFDGYTASANFKAYTYTPIKFNVDGIKMVFDSGTATGLWMKGVSGFYIKDSDFSGSDEMTVVIGNYCYNGKITNSKATQTGTLVPGGTQYGFAVVGSQKIQFLGCSGEGTHHALMMGGAVIPNRQIQVIGGHWSLTDETVGGAALDCHGNSEWVEFSNVQTNGVYLAGDNIKFTNNQVYGMGTGISIREMVGMNFTVSDNDVLVYAAHASSGRASGIGLEAASMTYAKRGGALKIVNNTVNTSLGTARRAISVYADALSTQGPNTDVIISGNTVNMSAPYPYAIISYGLAEYPFRSQKITNNIINGGGIRAGFSVISMIDDNIITGGAYQGIFFIDTGITSDAVSLFVRRNIISNFGYAGIEITGDKTHPYLSVTANDNSFQNVSYTDQGAAIVEVNIYVANALSVKACRNESLSLGANQSYNTSIVDVASSTVSRLFQNVWTGSLADYNTATTQYGDGLQTYTASNVTPDRSYDADSTSDAEIADVLGTLILDLQNAKIIK